MPELTPDHWPEDWQPSEEQRSRFRANLERQGIDPDARNPRLRATIRQVLGHRCRSDGGVQDN